MPHYKPAFTIGAGSWHHATGRAEPLWRSWCKSPIWKSIRRHRLTEEPRCRQCAIEGRTIVASHVDHIHLTSVSGYSFSNTRIPKACALTTTTCISNKRSVAIPLTHRQSSWMVPDSSLRAASCTAALTKFGFAPPQQCSSRRPRSPFSYLSPSLYRHWDHFCLLPREAPQVWAPRVGSMSHPRHRRDAMLRDTASKTVRGVRIAI